LDVVEVADYGQRRSDIAAGAEVPLEISDPEDEVGDGSGAGIDVDAEELMRVNGATHVFERGLRVAERGEGFEDFALQALEVFEGDVEEVAGAAGRVEDADVAKTTMKIAEDVDRIVEMSIIDELRDGTFDVVPIGTEGFDDGGHDESFDVGARRVMRTKGVPFFGIQRPFEQCAEDGGLNIAPVGVCSIDQESEFVAGQGESRRVFE
jgi:hypothetical protein